MPSAPRPAVSSRSRWLLSGLLAACIGLAGAFGLVVGVRSGLDGVRRETTLAGVLSSPSPAVENYLLVGSDSRAGADPGSPDFATMGSESDVGGERSDTLMVLRWDKASSTMAVLSVPRDLWLPIDGGKPNRINTAHLQGPAAVVRTVQKELGIPVHHYLEVDFQGFKAIVDAVGGVTICFPTDVRDKRVGFFARAGCRTLDGVRALKYARSRHYDTLVDGEWKRDGTSDLGRSTRQRQFLSALARRASERALADPFATSELVDAMTAAMTVDPDLRMLEAMTKLRRLSGAGVRSYALKVDLDTVGNASVVRLGAGARVQLDYFAGTGPEPLGK